MGELGLGQSSQEGIPRLVGLLGNVAQEGMRDREKSAQNDITEALAEPRGSPGAGMALQRHSRLRQRGRARHWVWAALGRGVTLAEVCPFS